jgi:hypothetical protein
MLKLPPLRMLEFPPLRMLKFPPLTAKSVLLRFPFSDERGRMKVYQGAEEQM